MLRCLPVLLIALACQGCFVFDELDKGQQIMEQHSPKEIDEEEAAPAARPQRAARPEPGVFAGMLEKAQGWWQSAREPAAAERAADDTVVRCELGERTQFTRKSDCQVRGGRIL